MVDEGHSQPGIWAVDEAEPPPELEERFRCRQLVKVALAAVVATLGGSALHAAILPVLSNRVPLLTFFPAITLSSWYAGFWSGFLCTLMSAGVVAVFFFEPVGEFALRNTGDHIVLLIFIATGATIAALNESLRRARAVALLAAKRAEQAQREAVVAARAKDEFLSVVSHELRTPLTSILGWASILRSHRLSEATADRAIETIERNALSQARIIDDLLDVSRIVTGKLRLSLRPMNPADVLRAAVDVVVPTAQAKGIHVDLEMASEEMTVLADPERLQQILWNILSNAVKFTPAGGRIVARLARDGDQVRIDVTDTGAGIAPAFLPHMFERFTQSDASRMRAHGGLGLGLAIAKHFTDLHGGAISATSDGPGKGTTLTVRLPLEVLAPAPNAPGLPLPGLEPRVPGQASGASGPEVAGPRAGIRRFRP